MLLNLTATCSKSHFKFHPQTKIPYLIYCHDSLQQKAIPIASWEDLVVLKEECDQKSCWVKPPNVGNAKLLQKKKFNSGMRAASCCGQNSTLPSDKIYFSKCLGIQAISVRETFDYFSLSQTRLYIC